MQEKDKNKLEEKFKPILENSSHVSWKPRTMLYPLPAVMISCGENEDDYNIITVSWVGTICSNPPMCYISIRPERHSYEIIKRTKEFVINLSNEDLAEATDWCGVKSGKDFNKFKEMKLTHQKGKMVDAPIIMESPLCIECKVKEIISLGSHDMFIAEVVNIQANAQYIDKESGIFDFQKANLITNSHGRYYKLGEEIGKFGWSLKKK
ncbi:MAG: flavin reductase family protein [Bacteroidales bacterium]|nr:flavin reductase family protein [Bacteroidales bacterium]